ncbi:amino acid permease [Allostreptomyces psammosilenae]|uniref:AAT family amino acid transporter n=1 Tax=Allostreptomyces psammosilenae TaxID=1892865 RepID=A0A853A1A2_9ACTN|nr:amino acid permease [Allostreptomyces psammosilenae]NYI08149.1 AAT family amino acid transporter [Allostreptomyces psammosilenae]
MTYPEVTAARPDPEPEPGARRGPGQAPPGADEGYQRGLGARQIQMIAIGSAIGVGLFLGAGTAITTAGPSLILVYVVAGAVIFLIMRALGELLSYRPTSGSFAEYAGEFIGPFAGFVTGWTYWIMWVTTGMAEITAAGLYAQYWFPAIPQWVTALAVLVALFGANLVSVRLFGEVEFWFSMIKVIAIVGMILIGLGVLTVGFGDAADTASVTHLWADGGLAPNGVTQTLMTLQIVMFAYLGVEMVGVTASETADPARTLPRAMNAIPWRIGLFYVGALTVILSVVPWREFTPGTSPFVLAFDRIGIPAAAGIVNFVVLTAALSSCNSGLYSTGRMLRSLSQRGQAPVAVRRMTRRRVPATAIACGAAVMVVGVVVNAVSPDRAFTYITSVATVGALWVWAVILLCHLRYRRAVAAGRLPAAAFRMPGAPYTTWLSLAFLALVLALLTLAPETRTALYVAAAWAVSVSLAYLLWSRRRPPRPVERPAPAPAGGATG